MGCGGVDHTSVPYCANPVAPLKSLLVIGTATTCFGSKIVRIVSATPLTVRSTAMMATDAAAASPFTQSDTAGARGARGAEMTGAMRSRSTRSRIRESARSVSTCTSGVFMIRSMFGSIIA